MITHKAASRSQTHRYLESHRKGEEKGKEDVKLSAFIGNRVTNVENPMKSIRKNLLMFIIILITGSIHKN